VDSKGRKILVLEQIPSELADGMGAGGAFKSALLAFLFISPPAPASSAPTPVCSGELVSRYGCVVLSLPLTWLCSCEPVQSFRHNRTRRTRGHRQVARISFFGHRRY